MTGKLEKNHSKKWKHNYVTKGNYTGTAKACVGKIRKAKELKKLQLARDTKFNQKKKFINTLKIQRQQRTAEINHHTRKENKCNNLAKVFVLLLH